MTRENGEARESEMGHNKYDSHLPFSEANKTVRSIS